MKIPLIAIIITLILTTTTYALPYWRENTTTIWASVNLTAGNNITYEISDGEQEANGNSVFTFFDDFTGTTLDTSKWKCQYGTCPVSNSHVNITGTDGWLYTNTTYGVNTSLYVKGYVYSNGSKSWWMGYNSGNGNNATFQWIESSSSRRVAIDGSETVCDHAFGTNEQVEKIYRNSTGTYFYHDETLKCSVGAANGNYSLAFYQANSANYEVIDYVFVTQQNTQPPSINCADNICTITTNTTLTNYPVKMTTNKSGNVTIEEYEEVPATPNVTITDSNITINFNSSSGVFVPNTSNVTISVTDFTESTTCELLSTCITDPGETSMGDVTIETDGEYDIIITSTGSCVFSDSDIPLDSYVSCADGTYTSNHVNITYHDVYEAPLNTSLSIDSPADGANISIDETFVLTISDQAAALNCTLLVDDEDLFWSGELLNETVNVTNETLLLTYENDNETHVANFSCDTYSAETITFSVTSEETPVVETDEATSFFTGALYEIMLFLILSFLIFELVSFSGKKYTETIRKIQIIILSLILSIMVLWVIFFVLGLWIG